MGSWTIEYSIQVIPCTDWLLLITFDTPCSRIDDVENRSGYSFIEVNYVGYRLTCTSSNPFELLVLKLSVGFGRTELDCQPLWLHAGARLIFKIQVGASIKIRPAPRGTKGRLGASGQPRSRVATLGNLLAISGSWDILKHLGALALGRFCVSDCYGFIPGIADAL